MANEKVQALAIDPSNSQVVYAVTERSVFKSADGGGSWTVTFQNIYNAYNYNPRNRIAIDPLNPQIIYVGAAGLYKSLNGGGSWVELSSYWTISALVVDPSASQNIYVGIYSSGSLKSTDGGRTWQDLYFVPSQSLPARDFAINPSDSKTVYAVTEWGIYKR